LQPAAQALAPYVGARQYRAHSGELARASCVDGDDAGVRVWAARERGLKSVRHIKIGRVRRGSGRFGVAVDSSFGLIEDRRMSHRAATLRRRQSANPARTLSACRAMSGCPSSPIRPSIATSLETRSSVGVSPEVARSTNARTPPPIR